MSRYMNRIIEINPEEGWVRVEAGVIKDQLNQFLKPYGYFLRLSYPPATAPRWGMINTDASGQDRWCTEKRRITCSACGRC